ncbi:heme exporter protein CcmD [Acidimangrovimonas sediminis]|uniref:heme exporter protein CcmD n=1 Tax=Acidimangrovimonas sediminis TaxID=2056283 RepID=UPI000C8044E6|nr:heme exporter protein CcmD [Acidimangrovimonas sediminis]
MPNLGKYEITVLSAYGAGIVLILALIAWTLWRGARVRRQLREAEERRTRTHG